MTVMWGVGESGMGGMVVLMKGEDGLGYMGFNSGGNGHVYGVYLLLEGVAEWRTFGVLAVGTKVACSSSGA